MSWTPKIIDGGGGSPLARARRAAQDAFEALCELEEDSSMDAVDRLDVSFVRLHLELCRNIADRLSDPEQPIETEHAARAA